MTETEKRVPDLRFKGFIEDWEQRKLGNLSEITDTKHATAPVVDSETPYKMIRTSAVRDGRLFPDRMDYVTYDTYEQWSERIHLKQNDVVISREAPMGEAAVIPTDNNKYFLGQRMVGIRVFDDLDPFFLLSTFLAPKFRKEIQIRNAESTTVANFGIPSIKGYEVDIPKKEEQTKIGSFFRQLDNTIALHQRKLTLLKQLKEAYLQLMFPQIGENSPALRFAGFSEPWEQRKVSSLAKETYGGGTPKTGVKKYWQGSYPWIQSSDLTINQLHNVKPTKFITEEAIKQSATHNVPGNSIAIVTRVGVGKLALMRYSYSTSQDFLSLSSLNVDAIFCVYCLYKMLQREINNIQGTSIKGITKADLLEKNVSVPIKDEEQIKIGDFFKKIDDKIYLHEKKLRQLFEMKQAFQSKMFI